jgi:hypothetical protein
VLRLYVICVALSACSDRGADKLAKVRDAVCACKTVKCAEAALDRVPKHDIESNHRTQAIAREMLNCLAELYEAEKPTQDPDAATPPETSDPASAKKP